MVTYRFTVTSKQNNRIVGSGVMKSDKALSDVEQMQLFQSMHNGIYSLVHFEVKIVVDSVAARVSALVESSEGEMINKLVFSFFKNPDLATITEYLTNAYLYSLNEAKKDAAKVCQRIEALKAKGIELEYNPFWSAYQVHHNEIGLRIYDGPNVNDAIYVAEGH